MPVDSSIQNYTSSVPSNIKFWYLNPLSGHFRLNILFSTCKAFINFLHSSKRTKKNPKASTSFPSLSRKTSKNDLFFTDRRDKGEGGGLNWRWGAGKGERQKKLQLIPWKYFKFAMGIRTKGWHTRKNAHGDYGRWINDEVFGENWNGEGVGSDGKIRRCIWTVLKIQNGEPGERTDGRTRFSDSVRIENFNLKLERAPQRWCRTRTSTPQPVVLVQPPLHPRKMGVSMGWWVVRKRCAEGGVGGWRESR